MTEIVPIDLRKIAQSKLRMLDRNEDMTQDQKDTIHKFIRDCYAEGIGHARVSKNITSLMKIALFCKKPFNEIVEDDLRDFIKSIEMFFFR